MKNTTKKHLPVQYGALAVQQHKKAAAVSGVRGAGFWDTLKSVGGGALQGALGAI